MNLRNIKKYLTESPVVVIVLGIIIRLFFYFHKPFLSDDYWTYFWVKNDLHTIVVSSFADFHPPLYYLIIKVWLSIFKGSLGSIRLFSLSCSILFLVSIYFLVKNWANAKIAKWAVLISSVTAGFIAQALNGRMYALGLAFVPLIIWSVFMYIRTGKSKYLLYYGITIVLAIYTYLHFVFLLLSVFLFSYLHKRITKQFIFAYVCIFISLIPLLYFLLPSMGNIQNFHPFIADNKLKAAYFSVSAFFPGEILFLAQELPSIQKYNFFYIFGLAGYIAVLIFQQAKKNFNSDGWLIVCFSLLPVACITFVSFFYKSILGIQPLIFFSIPLILVLAKIIYYEFRLRIIILSIFALTTFYYSLYMPLMETDIQPFLYVKHHIGNDDVVVVQDIYSLLWLQYFANIHAKAIIHTQYDEKVEQALQYKLVPLNSIQAKRVILLESTLYSGVHESQSLLKTQGYTKTDSSRFKQLTVSEFTRFQ